LWDIRSGAAPSQSLNNFRLNAQTNGYDRYGNRWIDLGGGNQSLYFNPSDNRITNGGFTYDSAGNLTSDTIHAYKYDGENKIKAVDSVTAHTYDGEGKRVKKLVGENTRFIYDIGGQVVAEFDGSTGSLKKEYVYSGATLITIEPTAINANGAQYGTSDSLSSPRVITNSGGGVASRHDYMPFGEELPAGVGGRTTGIGFSTAGDTNRKQYAGYERDTETELDFAQARFYARSQGRFTTPDFLGIQLANPQSLNLYAYVLNNPLAYSDPTGHQDKKAEIEQPKPAKVKDDKGKRYKMTVRITELGPVKNQSGNLTIGSSSGVLSQIPSPFGVSLRLCPTGNCESRTLADDLATAKKAAQTLQALQQKALENTDSLDLSGSAFWVISGTVHLTADGDVFVDFTPPQSGLVETVVRGLQGAILHPVPLSGSLTTTHIFYGSSPNNIDTRRSFFGGGSISLGGAIPVEELPVGPYIGGTYSPSSRLFAIQGGIGTAPQINGGYSLSPTSPVLTIPWLAWKK